MNREPIEPVTAEMVEAYRRDGAVHVPGVLDEEWVEHLRDAVALARTRPGPNAQDHSIEGESGGFFSDLQMSHRVPAFLPFITESPMGAVAAALMGSRKVNLLHDAMWLKEAGSSRRTPWHHDQPFYCMEGEQMCVMWVALDAHPASVSLAFLRGSHRWRRRFRPERINGGWYDGYGDGDGFEAPPVVENDPARFERLAWPMRAGDCVVFHGLTLHGSPGNHESTPRRAISLVVVGDDAVFVERGRETQPSYAGHGLSPGDPIDCDYFPRMFTAA